MDIMRIYWNSVWAHGRPGPASFLADHGGAEVSALERRPHPAKEEVEAQTAPHLDGRRRTADRATSRKPAK